MGVCKDGYYDKPEGPFCCVHEPDDADYVKFMHKLLCGHGPAFSVCHGLSSHTVGGAGVLQADLGYLRADA